MLSSSERPRWLTVVYRVPSKPSTLRIAVWKQARELGGLALQQSTYIFPDMPEVRLGLAQLQRLVEQSGGQSTLLEVRAVAPAQEGTFIEEFNRMRDEEYAALVEDLHGIRQRLADRRSRALDVREIGSARGELERAAIQAEIIEARDYFGAARHEEVMKMLEENETTIHDYEETMLAQQDDAVGSVDAAGTDVVNPAAIKEKSHEMATKDEIVARLREFADQLENGTLTVGTTPVGKLPDSAMLEVGFKDRHGKRKVEFEVKW